MSSITSPPDGESLAELYSLRLNHWRQTPETRVPNPDAAAQLIDNVGIATLFPASPEIPNLFHAYTGDPSARTESGWDSPAGEVYGWRWALGRQAAAFYSALVRSRPTWVSWQLLPALLRLRGETRTPDELYRAGELSSDAYRVAQVLEATDGVLSTGDLRRQAGYPTGKPQRAAYLKAVEELDTRLLLAKVFSTENDEMYHALVSVRYPEQAARAEQLTRPQALEQFLSTYLPSAVYAAPAVLVKHLKLDEAELHVGLERFVQTGQATKTTLMGYKGACYVWQNREV